MPEDIRLEYMSKLKFIPFSSLGKQNGMLLGIKPNYIKVISNETETVNENVIIGIYNKSLTKRGEYRALVGIDLIWFFWKNIKKLKIITIYYNLREK